MTGYVLRRLLIAVPVLLGISIIGFATLAAAPGDPITALMSPQALAQMTPARLAFERHQLGLDQPLPVRYFHWLSSALSGNLGYSTATGQPIVQQMLPRIEPTLLLMACALLITLAVGIPLGVIAAVRYNSALDYGLAGLSFGLAAVPTFVLGLLGLYAFGVSHHLLPTSGMQTLGEPFSVTDVALHLVLPASILGLTSAAPLVRYTRTSMLDVLGTEYMMTARAKGLSPFAILVRHGLRNALIPILTVMGLLLPELVAGAVITEQIFGWPGMGSLSVIAAQNRDPALMMGIVLVVATGVLLSNLLTDIAYAIADPRVRF